jgi:hypothetical protein
VLAGDEEANTRKDGEVGGGGGLWCSSNFDSSPCGGSGGSSSSATKRARPRCSETVRAGNGRKILSWGKGAGWPARSII